MADAFVLFLVFVVCVGGFSKGILGQLWALVALLIATFVTGKVYLPFVVLVSPFIDDEAAERLLAFVIVFLVIIAILNGPIYDFIQRIRGPSSDHGDVITSLAAAALGAVIGVVLVQIGTALLVTYPILGWDNWIRSSDLIKTYISQWPIAIQLLPPEFQYTVQLLH